MSDATHRRDGAPRDRPPEGRRGALPESQAPRQLDRLLDAAADRLTTLDASRLRRALHGLRGLRAAEQRDVDAAVTRWKDRLRTAEARYAARLASRPRLEYPPDLPVSAARERLIASIRDHRVVVVCGDTGSGKSTQLPKICLEAGRGIRGAIAHTQPRRIAARSVAARIAEELRVPLGGTIGVKTRFDDRTGPDTLVSVMTDGLLLAETRRDRDLLAYDTIIVDEAHERSLNIDFLLGYLARLLERRRDLSLIVTSATIDPERFSRHFGGAPIELVEGRSYPIETRYRPVVADHEGDEEDPDVLAAILAALREIDQSPRDLGSGRLRDVLVFLSGEREILETAEAIRGTVGDAEVLPLFARLSAEEQDRVFRPSRRRRIVLATNVAETSITVPGIDAVIDPGLARISRYSPRGRVQRLPVEPIAQASADQRRGRCGRTAPGLCIRLYSEEDYESRPRFTPPEVLRTNLASVILQMASLHLGRPEEFPFLDPPPPRLIAAGYETLVELGAMDKRLVLTSLGRRMSELPVDPRLARMLLASIEERCVEEMLVIVSVLSVQDPRERPLDKADEAAFAHLRFRDERSDFLGFLALWKAWRERAEELGSSALRRWCREHFLSWMRMREWTDVHRQLRDLVRERVLSSLQRERTALPDTSDGNAVHRALLAGLVANVGQLAEKGEYRGYLSGSGGSGTGGAPVRIHPSSVLAKRSPPWIIAAEIVETSRRFARICGRIQSDWIEKVAPHLCQRSISEPHWLRDAQQVAAWERVTLGGLVVVPKRRVPFGPVDPEGARDIFIQFALVEGELRTRAPFLAHNARVRADLAARGEKGRHAALVVGGDAVYAFYDARIPASVHSGPSFESWRREAEASDPRLLFARAEDLLPAGVPGIDDRGYPDAIDVGGSSLDLRYRHAPGEGDDGITIRVPRVLAGRLDPDRLEWMVPGLLAEKLAALLRTLPKRLRVRFQPAAEFALGAKEELVFGEGRLLQSFARYLARLTGIEVRPEDFDLAALPPHLRPRVEVLDDAGATLATGRDVRALLEPFRAESALDFASAVRASATAATWLREDLDDWIVGELPESIAIPSGAGDLAGFPALEDRSGSVAVTILPDRDEASRVHHGGVRRLLAFRFGSAIRHHLEYRADLEELFLRFAPLGDGRRLIDHLLLLALSLGMGDAEVPRSGPAFDAFASRIERRLHELAGEACDLAGRVLAGRQETLTLLDAPTPETWSSAVASMRADVARLLPPDLFATLPPARLLHLPRYLAAIRSRHRKLPGHLARDAAADAEITQWRRRLAGLPPEITAAQRAGFAMLLDEYQVQLFAGELRTALPVSAERVAAAWEALRE